MLFQLRYRVRGRENESGLIEAADLISAETEGKRVCDEMSWRYFSIRPAILNQAPLAAEPQLAGARLKKSA